MAYIFMACSLSRKNMRVVREHNHLGQWMLIRLIPRFWSS